jgi:hypothetical protein
MLNKDTIGEMLDRLGRAVTSGDLKQVSASYAFPALLLMEESSMVMTDPAEFEKMFGEGRKWYTNQGIVEARAEVLNLDLMTDTVAAVDVRWPGFDTGGKEIYTETSHYVIQLIDGKPLIRVALSRTK